MKMFAAPSAGAVVVTVVSGWMGRVRRHGLAIAISAAVRGLLIAAFGLAPDIASAWSACCCPASPATVPSRPEPSRGARLTGRLTRGRPTTPMAGTHA